MTKQVPPGSTAETIRHLYEQAGGAKRAAFLLGKSLGRTYQLQEEEALSLSDAARLTLATGATAAAELLATCAGGMFVPVEGAPGEPGVLLSDAARASGLLSAEAISALADGVLCPADKGVMRQRIDTALRVLIAARRSLSEA